jgi:RimJ/RimL family protein N-acetyltransferase
MITKTLTTTNSRLLLLPPNVTRDAPKGVAWLAGSGGRQTLALMGVADADNRPSTLKEEQARVSGFISDPKHLAWMMSFDNTVVGVVEVSFKATDEISLPAISIMIGDPEARGKGLGYAAMKAAMGYLVGERKFRRLYARHLLTNTASQALLQKLGFQIQGEPYVGADGLRWRNMQWEA